MPVYRFPTLLWQDTAGFFTAVPVEADDEHMAGFGRTATLALEQLRDYLVWLYQKDPDRSAPELLAAQLLLFKVPVRPEYHTGNRIYPCETVVNLPVHCVSGQLSSGLRVAALPLLDVRFYYHEPDALRTLVERYAQQHLKGLAPAELARFLPPPTVRLEETVVRVRTRRRNAAPIEERLPTLSQVAEPLSQRAVRKQYSPAWERAELVSDVVRRLQRDRGNLLLVGEPGCGKTTVMVEAVQQVERALAAVKKADNSAETGPTFWLTSASRLIAGMKYLGQWEERCESVIDELERLPGVLCVDRLLDLIRLGGSGPNDSLAAFLMPFLQRGELRLVSEATPAEAAACRRLLPGLVDLFPMVEVPALNRTQALAVLDRSLQRHGQDLRLEIAPGVSDRIYHLFRRFQPYQAFPGPAVQLVRELCERQARRHIANVSPENAVEQFVRRTGLPDWLLRDEVMLEADYLLAEFHDQVIGQDEAVQAAARVVTTFKAGLNDPRRPLGVLLFCGPTGVGKTELARTLAHILFSHGSDESEPSTSIRRPSEDRLLRLDMSEYAGPDAVSRLIGNTYGEPSPLIRRLRQQPCCVVLFDEIEKAGPEVFDVLLSICDEGRLTDTFGRTTTFCSSVIIMTSNLGSTQREAFGLNQSGPPSYSDIAAGFFRPEFFNRLDAVVTFQPLGQDTILMIARKELAAIARREGFVRAGLQLSWSERLVTWLAREGFDARHGARPLQRVLEQKVVALLARYLLANPELREARVEVDCDERGEVEIGKGRGG